MAAITRSRNTRLRKRMGRLSFLRFTSALWEAERHCKRIPPSTPPPRACTVGGWAGGLWVSPAYGCQGQDRGQAGERTALAHSALPGKQDERTRMARGRHDYTRVAPLPPPIPFTIVGRAHQKNELSSRSPAGLSTTRRRAGTEAQSAVAK
jgi:hypothetical protein